MNFFFLSFDSHSGGEGVSFEKRGDSCYHIYYDNINQCYDFTLTIIINEINNFPEEIILNQIDPVTNGMNPHHY